MSHHDEMFRHALIEAAAEFFNRESNRTSLITVTSATISRGGADAKIGISVLPDDATADGLEFVRRKRNDFVAYLRTRIPHRRLPSIDFVSDRKL